MSKFVVVLYGDHGGELDREEVRADRIAFAIAELAERCELAVGDRIVIEEARQ